MARRYMSIWFRHLVADYTIRKQPALKEIAFVSAMHERGRMVVMAVNTVATMQGIQPKMVVADCKAILPSLQVLEHTPGMEEKLLNALAEWCLRYTPFVSVDLPEGLLLDISGCAHLWGGETPYLKDIIGKLSGFGYDIRGAVADTIGTAWAIARYGKASPIIESSKQVEALLQLPPAALRLEASVVQKLNKLGLYRVQNFINLQRSALRRRFGQELLTRIDQALGQEIEIIAPVIPIEPYQERLPCLEPIRTRVGIDIALRKLLEQLCLRFTEEGIGLRTAVFKAYRIDGNIQKIEIGTNRPSRNVDHLFKLFEIKIPIIEPALGIELFILEAPKVEAITIEQDAFWDTENAHDEIEISELLDRIAGKIGIDNIHRYLPAEHYWPERSFREAVTLSEKPHIDWRVSSPRPIHLLGTPQQIEVTVAIPDYPPILFRYNGVLHTVKKADGPERIEQEWWITEGLYRDYYCVEDETGARYWLYRLGHYNNTEPKWYLHGFFA